MTTLYRLPDEPRPGTLSRFTVNPIFPLLALMMGGAWLGLPWFLFNGRAMGSATRRKEAWLALAVPVGMALLLVLFSVLRSQGLLNRVSMRYATVGLIVWKLAVGYTLLNLQQRSFALYEYYGGGVRNGVLVLMGGIFVGTEFVAWCFHHSPLLAMLLW